MAGFDPPKPPPGNPPPGNPPPGNPPPGNPPHHIAPPVKDIYGQTLSPAQIEALAVQYRMLGAIYGIPVSDALAREMALNGVGQQEARDRFTILSSIRSSGPLLEQYHQILVGMGIKSNLNSFEGKREAVMGEKPAQFWKVWDEYAVRAAAVNAGLEPQGWTPKGTANDWRPLKQDLQLSRHDISKIEAGLGIAPDAYDPAQLQQAAAQAAQWALAGNLSDSRARGGGLTLPDLVLIAQGGGTAEKQQALIRLQTEDKAFQSGQGHINTGNPQQTQGGGQVVAGLGNLSG